MIKIINTISELNTTDQLTVLSMFSVIVSVIAIIAIRYMTIMVRGWPPEYYSEPEYEDEDEVGPHAQR